MSIKIHGKEYVLVDERVKEFHKLYPNGRIVSKLLKADGMFIVETKVMPDVEQPKRYFTGLAYEVIGSSQINNTSALENCETSSVGRALGFLNIGLVGSIASGDEVQNAIHQQEEDDTVRFGKHKGKKWKDLPLEYLNWLLENTDKEWIKEKAYQTIDERD